MNRQTKFRVWCENIKGFRRVNIDGPKNSVWGVSINKGIFEIPSSERHVVELFTGLSDENGKEIYEGDIVCWRHPMEDFGEVKYVTESLGQNIGYFSLSTKRLGECFFQNDDEYLVIGNVHENPELL